MFEEVKAAGKAYQQADKSFAMHECWEAVVIKDNAFYALLHATGRLESHVKQQLGYEIASIVLSPLPKDDYRRVLDWPRYADRIEAEMKSWLGI